MKNFEVFSWNKSFETGINKIDEQHKTLVCLINELAYSFREDIYKESEKVFDKLIKYSEFHFKSEEEILKKYINSDKILSSHKNGHDSFLPKINEIKDRYKDDNSNNFVEETLLFLVRWLAFHIIDEDKRIIFMINFYQDKRNSSNILLDDFIKLESLEYDKQAVKSISVIWESTLRIKKIKELININKKLKNLINN